MLKTEIDEIEKLSNTDSHDDMHSDGCEMFEGEDCDCQNYHRQFLNLQKETLKLVAYVRKLERVRDAAIVIRDEGPCLYGDLRKALKACAGGGDESK